MAYVAILQVTLGLIFGSAFAGKIGSLRAFHEAVRGYEVIPRRLTWPVSVAVVVTELALAILLLLNLEVGVALLASSALLVCFAAATAVSLRRHKRVHCGCLGGTVPLRLGWPSAVTNVVLGVTTLGASLQVLRTGSFMPVTELSLSEQFVVYSVACLAAGTYWLGFYAMTVIQAVEDAIEAAR